MKPIPSLAAVSLLAIASCSSMPASQPQSTNVAAAAATISEAVLPASAVASLRRLCSQASPMLVASTSPLVPASISGIADYPESYCLQLAQAPAGTVPATTDAATPAWLSNVLMAAQVAARIAGVVLPLIL